MKTASAWSFCRMQGANMVRLHSETTPSISIAIFHVAQESRIIAHCDSGFLRDRGCPFRVEYQVGKMQQSS